MKNIKLNILVLLLLSIGVNAFAQDNMVLDKVITKVGGELILLSDLEQEFALVNQQQGGVLPPEARCEILQNQIVTKLLLNQSRLDSIEVGAEEVEAQLEARIAQILNYMNGDEKQFEAYYGQSINAVKEEFREDLESQLRVERMQGQIVTNASVTPREVKKFFQNIPKDSLPYFNSEVELAEIVYPPKVNDEELEIARAKLVSYRDEILGGAAFEELAKKYSDDPGSARVGGDLGWQRRGTFVPEFEAAAYNLEEGEMSEIIKTEFGYHLLRLEGRRGNTVKVKHILVTPEITGDDLTAANNILDSLRIAITADSLTFSRAVKRFSDENEQSFTNDGFMINPKTGNSFFEIKDLDPDIYFVLDTLTIGQISSPIEFRTPKGEVSYRIVKLISRTSPHTANLDQDYSKIRMAALEQKKGKFVNDWVLDHISDTFIEVDQGYHGCPNLQQILPEMAAK